MIRIPFLFFLLGIGLALGGVLFDAFFDSFEMSVKYFLLGIFCIVIAIFMRVTWDD